MTECPSKIFHFFIVPKSIKVGAISLFYFHHPLSMGVLIKTPPYYFIFHKIFFDKNKNPLTLSSLIQEMENVSLSVSFCFRVIIRLPKNLFYNIYLRHLHCLILSKPGFRLSLHPYPAIYGDNSMLQQLLSVSIVCLYRLYIQVRSYRYSL